MKNIVIIYMLILSCSIGVYGQMLKTPPDNMFLKNINGFSALRDDRPSHLQKTKSLALMKKNFQQPGSKQSFTLKHRLDSLIKKNQEPFKNTASLINDERVLFYYDNNQVQTHEISYFWEDGADLWYLDTRTDFVYDAFGQVISYTDSNWDLIGNQWTLDYKYEFDYDANGNIISETQSAYIDSVSSWSPVYLIEYTWNINGTLTSMTESAYDPVLTGWMNTYKYDYQYTATNNIEVETSYFWDPDSISWINQYKYEYSYDLIDNLVQELEFTWNATGSLWEEDYKTDYMYNANNLLAQELRYENNSSVWTVTDRVEYAYDIAGNTILKDYFYYDSWNSTWYNFTRDHLSHELLYSAADLILPETWWWFGAPSANMLTERRGESNYNGASWIDTYLYDYYYNEVNIIGIDENQPQIISVFPNPAFDQFRVSWSDQDLMKQFTLYDNTGRMVREQVLSNNGAMEVKDLNPGIYCYTLRGEDNNLQTGKIVVQ